MEATNTNQTTNTVVYPTLSAHIKTCRPEHKNASIKFICKDGVALDPVLYGNGLCNIKILFVTMEDVNEEDLEDEIIFPVPNVSVHVMKKIIEYLDYYSKKPFQPMPQPLNEDSSRGVMLPQPLPKDVKKLSDKATYKVPGVAKVENGKTIKTRIDATFDLDDFYSSFVGDLVVNERYLSKEEKAQGVIDLESLITASNYLDCQPLYDLACAQMSLHMMNKSPDEIYELFKCTEAEIKEFKKKTYDVNGKETQNIDDLLREENKYNDFEI
jgi:hypothetical protein